jgi:hypothetical protein
MTYVPYVTFSLCRHGSQWRLLIFISSYFLTPLSLLIFYISFTIYSFYIVLFSLCVFLLILLSSLSSLIELCCCVPVSRLVRQMSRKCLLVLCCCNMDICGCYRNGSGKVQYLSSESAWGLCSVVISVVFLQNLTKC